MAKGLPVALLIFTIFILSIVPVLGATAPTITSIDATNINQHNVTLESIFTYETWVDAYWVVDGVNQSKTNYTSTTSTTGQISYDSFEATFGNWTAVSGTLTTSTTLANCDTYSAKFGKFATMTQTVDATGLDSIIIDFDVIPIGHDALDCLYLYCDNIEYKSYGTSCDQSFAGGWESFSETLTPSDCDAFDNSVELKFYSYFAGSPTEFFYVDCMEVKNFTGDTHDEVITGLDWETEYDYSLCLDWEEDTVCSSNSSFTTANRTPPYINVATEYDIGHTNVSVGGTFFFEDYENVTAYVQIDGVNQTKTDYNATGSGASQYHTETITGLDYFTEYTWDFCIYDSTFGEICEGDTIFRTLDYIPPSFNIINAFNITNHEATIGSTFLYNDYDDVDAYFVIGGIDEASTNYVQVDEFDTSEYVTINLTSLDYATNYTYQLCVDYTQVSGKLVCDIEKTFEDRYDACNGGSSPEGNLIDNIGDYPSMELCKTECENTPTATCCAYDYNVAGNECYYGTSTVNEGSFSSATYGGACAISENETVNTICSEVKTLTTLDAYIPYITTSGSGVESETATLTGTYYSRDYPSTVPFFRLDGVDLYPKYNYTHNYTTPHTEIYNVTGLTANTTYNYTFCVGYGLGWSLIVCDTTANFTTEYLPTVTFASPNPINKEDVTLHWTVDWNGATNVTYNFRSSVTDVPAIDGVAKNYLWNGLTAETDYTYFLEIKYLSNGNPLAFNTSLQTVTTAYENEFDNVWDTLLQGSSFAKILLGFVILFGVIFLGVGAFGKYNIQISMVAVLIFTIIGTVLATLMKLFSGTILILVIVGSVVLMALQRMFMSGGER